MLILPEYIQRRTFAGRGEKGNYSDMPGLTGTSLGHYQLLERLGRGGMSEVYLAYDNVHQRNLAIKVVASTHADYIERFRREAYAVSILQHAHILPAYDYGEQPPWHYMVMPYIELGTLRDRLQQGPLTLEETGIILEQIANALQFAHDQGIVHRDIKPSNILLGDDNYVYLADFGLAKSLEGGSTITQTGNLLGTPEYMAPELSEGPATTSSDLYALGIVLYEMATGDVPFDGETPLAVFWKQIRDQPLPPTRINPAIPPAIEGVILRALEKKPQRRYQSANELAQAYIEALTFPDMVVEEPPPATSYSTTSTEPELMTTPAVNYREQVPMQDGALVLPNNPVMAPTAIPAQRRRFVKRISPYLQRRRRSAPLTPPPMEPLTPIIPTTLPDDFAMPTQEQVAPDATPVLHTTPAPRVRPARRSRSSTRSRSRRTSPVLISLLVIIILILLFGLIALFFTMQYNSATRLNNLATATANVFATATGVVTNATATQKAQLNATAGVALTATSGTLLLLDSLASNTNNRWLENTSCSFTGGAYHVIVQQSNALQSCTSNTFPFANGAMQADVTLLSGNTAGLLFRVSGNQFYDFEITNTGTFFLRRHNASIGVNYTYIIPATASSAILTGNHANRLLVIANGSDFKLYINGSFVEEAQDNNYTGGQIGFATGTLPSTATGEGSFANLKVYK
jgi:eukaryotic-like serine/threonine-protein kinase